QVDDPVGVDRVRRHGLGQLVLQTFASRRVGDALLHLPRLVDADAVLGGEALRGTAGLTGPFGRGVELAAAPDDLHVLAVLEAVECRLEAALADVAPGAHDVRPDLDLHSSVSFG